MEKLLVQPTRQPQCSQLRLWQGLPERSHPENSSSTFMSDVQLAPVLLCEAGAAGLAPDIWHLAPLTMLWGSQDPDPHRP